MLKKIIIVFLVIAVFGGGYLWFAGRNTSREAATGLTPVKVAGARPDSITTRVSADGSVLIEVEKEIKARLGGMVARVWVEEGKLLQEGDKIFSLDAETLNDQLENARLTLEEARVNYRSLQDTYNSQGSINRLKIEDARQNVEIARGNLEQEKIALAEQRQQAENRLSEAADALEDAREKLAENHYLYENDAVPYNTLKQSEDAFSKAERAHEQVRRDLEVLEDKTIPNSLTLAELRYENALNQLDYLKASIEREKITENDLELSRINVTRAEKQVRDLERELSRVVTTSPITGTVINLELKEGDKVMEGATVGKVADLDNLIVEVMVDEIDINEVKTGQEVVITSDSFEEELTGKVSYIAPVGTKVGNINKYAAKISIENDQGITRPGMFVNGEIITNRREGVITVPAMAVMGEEEKYVFVMKDGKAEKRVIEEGLKTISKVEVKGLEEGEQVIIGPFSVLQNLQDGAPVMSAEQGNPGAE